MYFNKTTSSSFITLTPLSFGSENAEKLPELERLAELFSSAEFTEEVRESLKKDPTQSFASARQACAERRLGRSTPELLQPNNILAVEYLKAIRKQNLSMKPMAIRRRGAGHDQMGESDFPSGSELRTRLRDSREIGDAIPAAAEKVFRREHEAGRCALDRERQDVLMLSRLRFLNEEGFLTLPDAADGAGKKLFRAVREGNTYDAVLKVAATRRYPLARVRRLCSCAVLGIRESDREGLPPYARILAFNEKGRALLQQRTDSSEIPLLTRPSQVTRLGARAQEIFVRGADAHDFYTLFYSSTDQHVCGADWRTGPAICT